MSELWDILDVNGNKTGRFHERGKPMQKGDYHLIVQVWILNSKGEFLITKRVPGTSTWANLWQTTGGCAVAGDDSLKTALKETWEETGILLNPEGGKLFESYARPHTNDSGSAFFDIWLFKQEVDISAVVFQPEEACDAKWANKQEIFKLIENGDFFPTEEYPYLNELFDFCEV